MYNRFIYSIYSKILTNLYWVLTIYKPYTVLGIRDTMMSKDRQGPLPNGSFESGGGARNS